MIRAVVVDDEALARRGLRLRLEAHKDVRVVAECANGRAALETIADEKPDVVFLDIRMPGIDGVEVARRLARTDDPPWIVFVTAYDEYALEAFEAAATDYLLKPVSEERVAGALERVRDALSSSRAASQRDRLLVTVRRLAHRPDLGLDDALDGDVQPGFLGFEEDGVWHRIPIADIDYVEAAGDYMCIRVADRTHVVRTTLAELEERLGPAGFLRIHRSRLVNADRIQALEPNEHGDGLVRLRDGTELGCSRTYRATLKAALAADR